MRRITIGYLRPEKERFIGNVINANNTLEALSHYFKVVNPRIDSKNFDFRKLKDLNIDYLLPDINDFGPMQFILREKHQLNIPFMILLRAVYGWIDSLVYIIPLIREGDIIIAPSEYAKNSFLRITDKFKVHLISHCLDVQKIQKSISCKLIHSQPEDPTLQREDELWPLSINPEQTSAFGSTALTIPSDHPERSRGIRPRCVEGLISQKNKNIVFMGRLIKEKGIGTLIDCMPDIISRVGDVHLSIIGPLSGAGIIGSPKSGYVKKLERRVRKLRLTNNVHFLGLKFGLEKYKILSLVDIFVLPTTIKEENFNISTLEALACGVPVITTNWATSKELIYDGENGYLLKVTDGRDGRLTFDKKYLISLIVKVLKNKELNLKLKKNAIKTAQKFDYRKVMPKLVKLLKKRTRIKVRNRWELIRDKSITDFSYLFNRDFIFFLYYRSRFKNERYSSLYKIMSDSVSLKNRLNKMKKYKSNTKDIRIMRKIQRNFSDLLLLRRD